MQLQQYLTDESISQASFGLMLSPGASQGLVSQWLSGKTRITLNYALQIQALSKGLVTPQECYDLYKEVA